MWRVAKQALVSCSLIILINVILFGKPKDGIEDSLATKILLEDKRSSGDIFSTYFNSKDINLGNEIVNATFEANLALGIKSKSYFAGQVYDYLRLAGNIFKLKAIRDESILKWM